MFFQLTFTTPSMASFTANFGPSTVLAPGPKYAASAKFRLQATYANLFLNKSVPKYILDRIIEYGYLVDIVNY